MGVTIIGSGGFEREIKRIKGNLKGARPLKNIAKDTVNILSDRTPKKTGVTADSWDYQITTNRKGSELAFTNSSKTKKGDIPIVVLIKNGHGTGTGAYIPPNDFITPVLDDAVRKLSMDIDKELK